MKELEKVFAIKGKKFLFKVETSNAVSDYLKYEKLRNEIWSFPEDNLPGARNMMCENFLHEGSSLFIAVYAQARKGDFKEDVSHLVGFSYGFVGVKDKQIAFKALNNLQFYSQYVGVRQDFRNYGFGLLIKEFQREKLLDLFGISTATCTYDPLTGINAFRNIHHFGMEVLEYRESPYAEYGGFLNRLDIPTDRFFMSWDLRKEIRRPDYHLESLLGSCHRVIRAENLKVKGKSGPLELEVCEEVHLDLDQEFLLVQIPFDFYLMLGETDVEDKKVRRIPLEWRIKTREAFQNLRQRKYKIIDFRQIEGEHKEDFYILWREKNSRKEIENERE